VEMLRAQQVVSKYLSRRKEVPQLIRALAPFEPKVVGGVVRNAYFNPDDLLDGNCNTDLDLTINTHGFTEALFKSLHQHDIEYTVRGKRNILLKFTIDGSRVAVDLTSLQKQTDANGFANAKNWADSARHRDLKCNALYYDLNTGKIEDFVDGTGDPGVRFMPQTALRQDPSRMFRFFRFVAEKDDGVYDEGSILRILALRKQCEAVTSSARHFRKVLENSERPGATFNKIVELGLDPEMFLVKFRAGTIFDDECGVNDLADAVENIQDLPRLCEALGLNKRDAWHILVRRIGQEKDLDEMMDERGIIGTANYVGWRFRSEFKDHTGGRFMFKQDELTKLGKNSLITRRNYGVTMLPRQDYIKEYLVMNY